MTAYIESGDIEIGDGENLSFCSRFIPDINFIDYDVSADARKTSSDPAISVTVSGSSICNKL